MSSMQKFNFSRVGRSVLLALSTATALVSFGALAQDTTEPAAQSEEDVERISSYIYETVKYNLNI